MKKELKISYRELASTEELDENQKKTVIAAEKAVLFAYAPYSNFKVGAALLLNDNQLILGSNQENKAYPSGLCAEQVALFAYGAQQKGQGIQKIAIVGNGELLKPGEFFSPCGSCRQVMAEYTSMQEKPFEIIIKNKEGTLLIFDGIHQLLPFIFGDG